MQTVRTLLIFVFFTALPPSAKAELPLTVEDLITDKGKIRLEFSQTYANSARRGVAAGEPITVQTGDATFVNLPTVVGERRGNSDTLVATLGLRYGLTDLIEVYTRAAYLYSSTRGSDLSGVYSTSDHRFADAWAGLNHQFKKDDEMPALIGFAELALREKHRIDSASFKSWMLGLTTYRAIDPVVLSLTASYRFNHTRKDGVVRYNPGNMMQINPSTAFAVNDRITLTTGLQWTNHLADAQNGKSQDFRRTRTDLLLGIGYGINKDSTLNATLTGNTSGIEGTDLRLNWLHTFKGTGMY